MRAALAVRDIAAVFRLLKRLGISQRRMAGLTGQSQPEVSDIVRGRVVMSYDLLARIAGGLGIPPGLMGLAYTPGADPADGVGVAGTDRGVASWVGTAGVGDGGGSDDVERRAFIGLVAQAALVGLSASEWDRIRIRPTVGEQVSAARQLGYSDAVSLERAVTFYRAQDDELGGGAIRSAVAGHLQWASGLMDAPAADDVRTRVTIALADLHSVAGWASFDTGHYDDANRYLANALTLARDADQSELTAKVLFQLGRVFLHRQDPSAALKMFQLGQAAAHDADSPRALALLNLNAAWSYAEMGKADQAVSLLARASDEMGRDKGVSPAWLGFMGQSEIDGISAMTYTALSARDRSYADRALTHAMRSHDARPESDARSRTSDLVAIAANQLRAGNVSAGVAAARQVIPRVEALHSTRLTDRLGWITHAARLHPHSGDAREITDTITALRSGINSAV
jgi:tetratricopeptide (TPR) repeat protein